MVLEKTKNKINYNDFRSQSLENTEVKAEYDNLTPKYDLIRAVLNARNKNELSQQELRKDLH